MFRSISFIDSIHNIKIIIMTAKQSPLQRIKRVMDFYYKRGCNKENVNALYKRILKDKFQR